MFFLQQVIKIRRQLQQKKILWILSSWSPEKWDYLFSDAKRGKCQKSLVSQNLGKTEKILSWLSLLCCVSFLVHLSTFYVFFLSLSKVEHKSQRELWGVSEWIQDEIKCDQNESCVVAPNIMKCSSCLEARPNKQKTSSKIIWTQYCVHIHVVYVLLLFFKLLRKVYNFF